ncbi:MAG: hydroxylamine reductase [bacterium]
MFCYQCEQTAKEEGCTSFGVCGKDPETAALQDVLIKLVKGISMYAHRSQKLGKTDNEINRFMVKALFTTVTNVDFNADNVHSEINKALELREKAKKMYQEACDEAGKNPEKLDEPATWQIPKDKDSLIRTGEQIQIDTRMEALGKSEVGLQELILYGLKGAGSYVDHAQILEYEQEDIYAKFHELLDYLTNNPTDIEELLDKALQVGELNLQVMKLLDSAHTDTYGDPEPTEVRVEPEEGKAILVSGHDLKDLEELLKQTRDTGIKVYTHGEMLPAHGYPELNKYDHLAGNYGGAWQDQRREFDEFPGSILMTTNCIQKPKDTYKDRIFTKGRVSWPGVEHIEDYDFSPLIGAAQDQPGFQQSGADKTITVGFGHNAVAGVADQVVDAVQGGDISHFFFIGGCDGAKPGRNYFTELAEKTPEDSVILTAACGKYRFNKKEFGDIGGIPRLLDVGQCNDSYSAVQIALTLADAFDCGVNELPLDLVVSWFEQKAVAILLTLLHLDIKGIRLGPTAPAFISPEVFEILQDAFDLKLVDDPDKDLEEMIA